MSWVADTQQSHMHVVLVDSTPVVGAAVAVAVNGMDKPHIGEALLQCYYYPLRCLTVVLHRVAEYWEASDT
jgi:hypothetical protein